MADIKKTANKVRAKLKGKYYVIIITFMSTQFPSTISVFFFLLLGIFLMTHISRKKNLPFLMALFYICFHPFNDLLFQYMN